MKKTLLRVCVVLALSLTSLTALAADVTGTWAGDMKTPDGAAFHISFTFKQDGTKLTGSVKGAQGDPIAFDGGTVTGDKLSFKVVYNGTTFLHEGTINGDEIVLTTKSDQGPIVGSAMVLNRLK